MVQKVLCIILVLLWTMPLFMAKHKIKTKYTLTQKINYREVDEIINKPLTCVQGSNVMNTKWTKMVQLIFLDQNEIPAYNIDDY